MTCGTKFQPVSQVIATMSQERRELLANKIKNLMNKIEVSDVILFTALVSGDCSIRSKVVGELVDYLRHEMSMALVEWHSLIPVFIYQNLCDTKFRVCLFFCCVICTNQRNFVFSLFKKNEFSLCDLAFDRELMVRCLFEDISF